MSTQVKKAGVREGGARESGVCSVCVSTITVRILSEGFGWVGGWVGSCLVDFKRRSWG